VKPPKIEVLLSELCVELGFCLPPQEITRLQKNPPRDIESFTKAVFEAEGMDAGANRQLLRQVQERVAAHFRKWDEENV
jgi:hypothetical protein